MPQSKLVALVFDTWEDADRVMEGLTPEHAAENFYDGSSFAWTAGHIANTLDFWVNVRFAGHKPHPLISQSRFRFGGDGEADDWESIRCGAAEVRSKRPHRPLPRARAESESHPASAARQSHTETRKLITIGAAANPKNPVVV